MPLYPPPSSIRLRPATQADIPRLTTILIRAFRPGPWSAVLFPPHLRSPGSVSTSEASGEPEAPRMDDDDDDCTDEFHWRAGVLAADLAKPGRRYILAVQSDKSTSTEPCTAAPICQGRRTEHHGPPSADSSLQVRPQQREGAQEEAILGWASWVDQPIYAPPPPDDSDTGLGLSPPPPSSSSSHLTPAQIAAERQATWGSLHPPGLDVAAFEDLVRRGEAVEAFAKQALVGEGGGWVDAVELHYLVIDPPHQRKGIGHHLLREGLAWAATSTPIATTTTTTTKTKPVWLRSTPEGRLLYRSLGFEQVGPSDGIRVLGHEQYPMVYRH